tara:strand:+ start:213 stop:944 length:732 start_codon:yes stop_codon:yes gene_type:complete
MKKTLLVSGCSNTEESFYSELHPELDTSWPKWPELLAKKLDMDYVNLGKSGAGNDYIYRSLLNYITRNDSSNIGLVIPAWSQCNRKDYQEGNLGRWTNARIDPNGDVFSWMKKTLDNYVSFQILCEKYNLNYLHVQMLMPYQDWLHGLRPRELEIGYKEGFRHVYPGDPIKDGKKIIKIINSYEDLINTKKFLGWPLCYEMGGYSIQKELINMTNNTMISNLDSHPNKLGQEKIAEFIYDRLG